MRKALVALFAVAALTLAGALIAAPRITSNGHQASAVLGLDIFGITQRARDLPDTKLPNSLAIDPPSFFDKLSRWTMELMLSTLAFALVIAPSFLRQSCRSRNGKRSTAG